MNKTGVNYHSYLKLDELLNCQELESEKANKKAHDEMLFIIVHQTYELWFKQILTELDSILEIFSKNYLADHDLGKIVLRLGRIKEIQNVLVSQINVLETMTALDFLDFRDFLYPASGFQSLQFRLVENKLGLKPEARISYNKLPYSDHLPPHQKEKILATEKSPSLLDCVEAWLMRTPFLQLDNWDFWQTYRSAVQAMFERERQIVASNVTLGEQDKQNNYAIIDQSLSLFDSLFDPAQFEKKQAEGLWRLNYKAIHAALFIQVYRDQPALQQPFKIISALLDIDELMTTWRYRHALMVRRMLGTKVGTGGSSGYQYLRDSAETHRVFNDFFQLTTFFIPRSALPPLPKELEKKLGFVYQAQ